MNRHKSSKGYLLIEVGIVLALIALVVGLSLPTLRSLHSRRVEYELHKMRQFIHFIAQKAVATGQELSIHIDTQHNCYYADQYREALPHTMRFGVPPGVKGPPSTPTRVVTSVCSFAHDTITCYPMGTLSAGTLYVTDASGSCCYAVTIAAGGEYYVRLYKYGHGTWKPIK